MFTNVYGEGMHDTIDVEHMVSHSNRETNADRFRRGLGPLPPKRRDRSNIQPRASAVPCVQLSNNIGMLQIRRLSDGKRIGYIGTRFNRENAYTICRRPRAALRVAVPPVTPLGGAINLIAANAPDSGTPVSRSSRRWPRIAILSGTSGVRANSPPTLSAGTSLTLRGHGGVESQIWIMNCQTHQVTAQWINPDGARPRTTIFYDPARNLLGLTGDLQAFNTAVSQDAFEVTTTFIPE
ncbi:hypothetical protein MVEN_00921800 [Mycena venus]|uniref:Uncharacterized protein n=1 Tax=Mycena venus TaxID=2733690 RepID=A0A8H6YCH0_9AGAR|nr:hypothetical protein MVEN_00921800 [Mycena venus]